MTNQPIEEKWKIDFRKEFPSFLTDTHNGKIVPIHNGWWVFVQGYKRRNLPQDIEDFIENLLEQERKRMSDEIEKLRKEKTADRQLIHFDHTVEHIKYYESDSDPAFNKALDKVLSIINK